MTILQWDGKVYADAIRAEYGNPYDSTLSKWANRRCSSTKRCMEQAYPRSQKFVEYVSQKATPSIGNLRRQYFYRNISPGVIRHSKIRSYCRVRYLVLRNSISPNKCNPQNVEMCGGEISEQLDPRRKTTKRNETQIGCPNVKKGKYYRVEFDAIKNILEKKEYFRVPEFLKLTGGEPLMEEQNYRTMEQFIEWGIAKNIVLDINTNGTVINEKLFDIAKQFKKVKFADSYGWYWRVVPNISRGGENFTLKQLEENIKQFNKPGKHTTASHTVTVQIYNIFNIVDIWRWYKRIRQKDDEIFFQ